VSGENQQKVARQTRKGIRLIFLNLHVRRLQHTVLEAVKQIRGWRRLNVNPEEFTFPPIVVELKVLKATEIYYLGKWFLMASWLSVQSSVRFSH